MRHRDHACGGSAPVPGLGSRPGRGSARVVPCRPSPPWQGGCTEHGRHDRHAARHGRSASRAAGPLSRRGPGGEVTIHAVRPLGAAARADDSEGFGYGGPLEIECTVGGAARSLVLARTRPVQGFGMISDPVFDPGDVRSLLAGAR